MNNKKQDKVIPMKRAIILIVTISLTGGLIIGGVAFFIIDSIISPSTKQTETMLDDKETNIDINEYKDELQWLLGDMELQMYGLKSSCNLIATAWRSGILNGKSVEYSINQGLTKLNEITTQHDYDIGKKRKDIKERLQNLSNPSKECEDIYELTVEAYGYYMELYNSATDPSGTYETYVNSFNKSSSEFEKIIEKILVVDPDMGIGALTNKGRENIQQQIEKNK